MVKVVEQFVDSNLVRRFQPVIQTGLMGVGLGAVFYLSYMLLSRYFDQEMPGNITSVIVAFVGILLMVQLRMPQPLLINIAGAIALWGLATWIDGLFWVEALAWSSLLYGLAYLLFAWLTRYKKLLPLLLLIAVSIAIIRLVASL